MTLKKSMISIAAAGVIAATITGCGSSGSDNNYANNGFQPTSLKAIDGYVIGAKIEVGYMDTNVSKPTNSVKTTPVDNTKNYALTADKDGKVKAGTPTYSIADVNSTVFTNLRYIKLTPQNGGNAADGSVVYAPTYIDASDTDFTYDPAKGDEKVGANFALIAPAGYSVITPITTLVYEASKAAIDKNESNMTAIVESTLKNISAALGVSANDIKTLDPLSALQSKPEYAIVNAFLKDVIESGTADVTTIATALATQKAVAGATPALKLSSAFANLETSATAGTKLLFTTAKNAFAGTDGNNYYNALKTGTYNVDKTRNASKAGTFTLAANALELKDINVTAITVDDKNISNITSKGDKVNQNNVAFNLSLQSNSDTNVTKKATFVTKISLERAFEIADKNVTDLTISLPIVIGAKKGGDVNVSIAEGTKVSYAGRADDGTLVSGDLNASYIMANGGKSPNAFFAQITDNKTLELNATALINAVDDNLTKANINGKKIANLQVALVDTDSSLARIGTVTTKDATIKTNAFWSPLTIHSYNAASTFVGKTLLDLTAADMRGTETKQNVEGNASVAISASSGTYPGTDVNTTSAKDDANLTLRFLDSSADKGLEGNVSITSIAATSNLVTLAASTLKDLNSTNDLNLTVNAANVIAAESGKHPTVAIKYVANDEFGLAGKEQNLTLTFNRAPKIEIIKGWESNSSTNKIITLRLDPDGDAIKDGNITVISSDGKAEANLTIADGNWSVLGDYNLSLHAKTWADKNNTIYLDINSSTDTNISTFKISGYNLADTNGSKTNTSKTDANLTLNK